MPERGRWLHELPVHPYVRGVADTKRLFEFVQAGAPAQQPDGEGVAEVHRGDAPHPDLVASCPEGVLQRLGGRDGTGCAGDDELWCLVVAHPQVAEDGLYRLPGEAPDTRGEV